MEKSSPTYQIMEKTVNFTHARLPFLLSLSFSLSLSFQIFIDRRGHR